MTAPLKIECTVHFHRQAKGRKRIEQGPGPAPLPPGRVPRVARLMALAIRFDRLLRNGEVKDQAELARLGQVTRARVTQIMNLLLLAPDIQEELLFLPLTKRGRDPIKLAELQPIALALDWKEQRRQWARLRADTAVEAGR